MTTSLSSEEILAFYKLKSTACRKVILNELLESKTAMTEQEIKSISGGLFDRVTFYRTLKTLEEAGVIHSIVLSNNLVKYAISTSDYNKVHSHFYCTKCNSVKCLHDAVEIKTDLPKGFSVDHLEIVIKGICENCN